jgi:phage FluMu protein Com
MNQTGAFCVISFTHPSAFILRSGLSMPIVVRCDHCGASLKVRDENRGKRAKCPKCQGIVSIVAREESATAGDDDAAFLGGPDAAVTNMQSQDTRPAKPVPQPESAAIEEPSADEEIIPAKPLMTARPAVRVVVLIVLLIPVFLASRFSMLERLMSCFVPLMLTGTYRISTIRGGKFATRFYLAFYPVVTGRCKLQSVVALNVKYGHVGSGMGTLLLLGPAQMFFGRIFDFLMPAIGGPYQIHLVTAKGRELVAWQGFSDSKFESTLNMLIRMTNAEVRSV